MTTVIGLTGAAGAGKDTLAAALAPHGFERFAFADGIKALALGIDPIVHVSMFGSINLSAAVDLMGWDELKREGGEVRRIIQNTGAAARATIGPTVWLDVLGDRITDAFLTGRNIVVTDVRFPNEVDLIHALGGLVVNIRRPDNPHALTGPAADHPSEQLAGGHLADYFITNDQPGGYTDTAIRWLLARVQS